LATYEALVSAEYLASLNAPSEWSRKMMPHHRHMVRSPGRVLESRGSTVAGHAITVRFSPAAGAQEQLRRQLHALVQDLPTRPGLAGAHLLQTDTPALAPTTEQQLRGLADRAADWILVVTGYDVQVLRRLVEGELSAQALQSVGAADGAITATYGLRHSGSSTTTTTATI
ncbi:hypothetical protein, partial [Piscinibacter sp.]|uniref:hypothetical protein n=1 Tax=Piscinibacter sp. TaxID=1903157 RepID=UPI002B64AC89